MPRAPTGLATADAQDDFLRARRRGQLARLVAFLRREPDDVNLILPYDEVVKALGTVGKKSRGLETIKLDSIVGTVDRTREFDRAFRPLSSQLRGRWERIAKARRSGEPMPPIDVIRIGEVHFVQDGHHRVSVALAQGDDSIDANVVEVLTKVGMDHSIRLSDLPLKSHERLFHERVPLPRDARKRIKLSNPEDYGALAEGADAWSYRAMQLDHEFHDRETMARRWFAEEYEPAVDLLREAKLLDKYATETDAYFHLTCLRYELMQSQEWSDEALHRVRKET